MAINQYLDLSTAHITKSDSEKLANPATVGLVVRPYEYGWWIHVPQEHSEHAGLIEELRQSGYSEAFSELITYARKHRCLWINLDQDAETHGTLPLFKW